MGQDTCGMTGQHRLILDELLFGFFRSDFAIGSPGIQESSWKGLNLVRGGD